MVAGGLLRLDRERRHLADNRLRLVEVAGVLVGRELQVTSYKFKV